MLKTIEISIAFAIGLHEEIDASRFSGPEQFSAGAPLISPYFESAIFRRRFDRFPMPRSIEALKNDRKIIRVSLCLHKEIDAYFSTSIRSISMPRSIEALKNDRKVIRVSQGLHKEIDTFRFSGPEQFSADAPLILLLFAKIIFRRRFD